MALCGASEAQASPTNPGDLTNPLETGKACEVCHLFANPAEQFGEPNHSPGAFLGSMMGNSARDPVFWAGVALAHQDDPEDTNLCIRCHAPRAFLDGRGDIIAQDELTQDEREGITCDLCHRMFNDGETEPGNAQWTIDDVLDTSTNQVPKRGPWTYDVDENHNHPTSDENDLQASSRMCGTCHDVTTVRPRVDDEGELVGHAFNEQRTYREWVNSSFSNTASSDYQTCQGCHMPEVPDVAGCNVFLSQGKTHEDGGRRHDFLGANRFMMELISEQQAELMIPEVPMDIYANALDNIDAFMPTAATVEVEFPDEVDLSQGIAGWGVRVQNETGHKLPSGYSEGRVMFLEVTATYDGELLYSSGLWTQSQGEIQDDPQVRRYEGIADEFDTGQRNHLLLNNHWVLDNRIPPKGLREDPQTDPVNSYFTAQSGVWPHWDETAYNFPSLEVLEHSATTPAEIELRVRLLYVINTKEYIDELADANVTNSAGEDVASLFAAKGGASPAVLSDETITVPLVGLTTETPSEETGTTSAETGEVGSASTEDESDDDAAATDDEGGKKGCDCRSDDDLPPPIALLGLVGIFGLRRRRRQRRAKNDSRA